MKGDDPIRDLVRARDLDAIGRDEYWGAMRDHHVRLEDYQSLLERAGYASLEIGRDGLILRDHNGLAWSWQPDQVRSPLSVRLNDGAYEDQVERALTALAATTTIVLDVGANIGYYTIRLATIGTVEKVHAFEPVSSTCATLRRNVALNGLEAIVSVHESGLSDRHETVTFYIPIETGNVAASERELFEDQEQERVDVRLDRLDDLDLGVAPGRIGLIKCDIEGGEFGFLRGAERVLSEGLPFVMLEMLRKWSAKYGYTPNDIIDWMRQREFRCFSFDGAILPVDVVGDDTAETNFLFVHSTRIDTFRSALRQGFAVDRVV